MGSDVYDESRFGCNGECVVMYVMIVVRNIRL